MCIYVCVCMYVAFIQVCMPNLCCQASESTETSAKAYSLNTTTTTVNELKSPSILFDRKAAKKFDLELKRAQKIRHERVCMYLCMYVLCIMYYVLCMYVCLYVRMFVCTYVCLYYVCMYVCMYVCKCMFSAYSFITSTCIIACFHIN